MKKMIYYYPNPLSDKPNSGSSIRPLKMLKAFQDLGYEVDIVSGYSTQRKQKIKEIKQKILNGTHYSFMYGENTSMPTALSDRNHIPSHPIFDLTFLKYLYDNNIPAGLFYRDIYWKFETYNNTVPLYKRIPAKFFYHLELMAFNRYLKCFYLPSKQMLKYIPYISDPEVIALPPAYELLSKPLASTPKLPLKLLYVGGMSDSYKIHELFKCIKELPDVILTVCTRKKEWDSVFAEYQPFLSSNINIVHESGEGLKKLYKECDLSLMFFYPDRYREFAMPVKLYEYLAWEKPIISSKGTLVSSIIEDLGIGWVVNYSALDLMELLVHLTNNINEIQEKIEKCKLNKPSNTWLSRAKQVESQLVSNNIS